MYKVEEAQTWRLPLLQSLLEIRDDHWEVRFGDDDDDDVQFEDDDIKEMIHDVCTS